MAATKGKTMEARPAGETVLVTGGAGYIGSLLCGVLLEQGYRVRAVDDLLFGGDSLLAYLNHPGFSFHKVSVCEKERMAPLFEGVSHVVHLAAIVGFPACQQVGRDVAFLYNLKGTENAFELAEANGARRFVFASTYSNYGKAVDNRPVDEGSPLHPQSLYAETKIAAERFLLERDSRGSCRPVVFRFSTLFGLSPRTRFDLIINQFVLEAIEKRKLVIFQKNYNRSFVHVRDVAAAVLLALTAEDRKAAYQIFNVGSREGNYSKEEIIRLIQKYVPGVAIEYKDLSFGGDMRDIRVSFDKIERVLGFRAARTAEEGIRELADAILSGFLFNPHSNHLRNAQFIVQ